MFKSVVSVEWCWRYADCSLLKFEDSVICGRSRVKANLSKILDIVFKLDYGSKTCWVVYIHSRLFEQWWNLGQLELCRETALAEGIYLASLAIRGAKTPVHRFKTDVGTNDDLGDDLAGMVFRFFITSSTVTGVNSVSCGPWCAPSKKNG